MWSAALLVSSLFALIAASPLLHGVSMIRRDDDDALWRTSLCNSFPDCQMVDGQPILSANDSQAQRAVLASKKDNRTDEQKGLQGPGGHPSSVPTDDHNKHHAYQVLYDTTFIHTGVCDPSLFLSILLDRSGCGTGSNSTACSGKAKYRCDHVDDKYGEDMTDGVADCTMSFMGKFDTNLDSDGSSNTTLADKIKDVAKKAFKSAMTIDGGNKTILPDGAKSTPKDTTRAAPVTVWTVPQNLGVNALRLYHHDGVDKNTEFGSLAVHVSAGLSSRWIFALSFSTMQLECPVPSAPGCGFLKALTAFALPGLGLIGRSTVAAGTLSDAGSVANMVKSGACDF